MLFRQIKAAVEVYHHLPRYREIFRVFFKYGFVDMVRLVHLQKLLEIKESQLPSRHGDLNHQPPAVRFRMALEELGPTFVKFGQILSSRRDLINESFYQELHKLQDQVPPFPGEEAKKIIERELNHPIDELFQEFDIHALAGASIAQVHQAVLLNGKVVAVKVQRPEITKVIEIDLAILADVARFLDRHVEEISVLNPVGIVQEFAKTLSAELDFTNEARNMERFAEQFRGNRTIRVPKLYNELTTERVLTMEFLKGYPVDQPNQLREHNISPITLSERMSKLLFQQMFEFGFFHGDPHPGNITILLHGVACLYDYGMMGILSPTFREDIATMILGLIEKDQRKVTRSLLGMSETGFADDLRKLESDVETFAEQYLDRPLKDLKLGFVLNRLLDVLMAHKLRMKSDFYLGVKALAQVEAIGEILNPDLNFVQFGEPYATQVIEKKYEFGTIFKNLIKSLAESLDWLRDLPTDTREMYERIKSGRYKIPIEHRIDPKGFEPLRSSLNHIAHLLADAMLTSSILICSSILILAGLPPKWHEMPVLGVAGLIFGGMMFLRLVLSIWKHGGL